MTDERITDFGLWRECKAYAQEIFDEWKDEHGPYADPEDYRDEMTDRAHETADGHQWVIYTYKAIQLCAECDTQRGEEFLDDCGGIERGETFGGIASKIAYGEIRARIEEELSEIIDEYEPEEEPEDEDEDEDA